mgnify:CR=1 FL=1
MQENKRDKEYTEGIKVSGGFLTWLDNYWYHYKWPMVVVCFFLIVGLICGLQMCNRENEDLILLYSGSAALSAQEVSDICEIIAGIVNEDFDGDGNKKFAMSKYNVLSEEQIREEKKKTDASGNPIFVDTSYYSSQASSYYTYIQTGESSVAFLEPWLYESLIEDPEKARLQKLSDVLGYVPDSAYGEYGIRLGDTDLYRDYGVIRNMPADTVICLFQPLWKGGKSSKEEFYAREKKTFIAIVEYGNDTQSDT